MYLFLNWYLVSSPKKFDKPVMIYVLILLIIILNVFLFFLQCLINMILSIEEDTYHIVVFFYSC